MNLYPVLDFLAASYPESITWFEEWKVAPESSGRNNRVARISLPGTDLVVKFYRTDGRDRAWREFMALAALRSVGLNIAPEPLLLDRQSYPNPVIVQTWMVGRACEDAPDTEGDWQLLLEHYTAIHLVTPERLRKVRPSARLMGAFMSFRSAREAVELVLGEIERLPAEARRADLRAIAGLLKEAEFPSWPEPALCLARCDPSAGNFLRRPWAWASVDWEYAGWGDPGFETGDLMTHPHYRDVSDERWEWLIEELGQVNPADEAFSARAWAYQAIMLVRWLGVFARYWHLRDTGQADSSRLGTFPPSWWQALPQSYGDTHLRALDALEKRRWQR